MRRPVEVYRKKTKLLLIALFSITFGYLGIWSGISKYDVLSFDFALRSIGEIILLVGGFIALVRLLSSLIRHEPYLLVYDDHIEVYNEFSNRFSILHFCDIVYMEKKEKKTTVNFHLEPFLKKSDYPEWFHKWNRKLNDVDYVLSVASLNMKPDDVYNLIQDKFRNYKKQ